MGAFLLPECSLKIPLSFKVKLIAFNYENTGQYREGEQKMKITVRLHTDKHEEININPSKELKLKDVVYYIPNGLKYTVDNMKMLKWMLESGNYVKEL